MGKVVASFLLLGLPFYPAFANGLNFSGSLERLTEDSISIRLADRRIIDAKPASTGELAADKIARRYKFGDHVEIACDRIQPSWEDASARLQFLELKTLRFIREASADELSGMRQLPAWREEANLLQRPHTPDIAVEGPAGAPNVTARGPEAEGLRKLERAREVNLDYAANLPNFIADETAKRYTSDTRSTRWHYIDTIEAEVTFQKNRATRVQVRRNGRKWDRPFQALPGFKWGGGFGAEIRPLFDLQCPTRIQYDGPAEIRGRPALKFNFDSPADGCFNDFYVEYQRYNPARTGHISIDDRSGNLIHLEEDASPFPAEFDFARRQEEVSWDSVKIGDASYLLPVAANFVVDYSSGKRWRVEVEYKNHRHFESSTDITFH